MHCFENKSAKKRDKEVETNIYLVLLFSLPRSVCGLHSQLCHRRDREDWGGKNSSKGF